MGIIMDELPTFPWLAPLLQASDSAFPTGAYAHSLGFEQIVRLGVVRDAATLGVYLEKHLWPALIHLELPVVRFAAEAARAGDELELLALDNFVEVSRAPRELRDASRATGRRRLHALLDSKPEPVLAAFARAVSAGSTPGHHPVVFGAGLAALPSTAPLGAWAYQNLAAACFAAPKLLRIGQDATRRALAAALAPVEKNIATAMKVKRDDIGWFDPLVDLASMQHEIAHERLFIS